MMAKDQEEKPVIADHRDIEEVTPAALEKPCCPGCGWSNTRHSVQHSTLDLVLETFGLHAFRCRSCGKRFRRFRHRKV